ncbi:MAG: ROK family transcriptional regulator [Chloroflexi bacterium]|nr:ROK family transcriptional regulator [Chloroflexota bacterium]
MKHITPVTQSGSNLKDIKLLNRAVVFRAIREASAISRADLAKQTGLNPATLTHITRELLERGLIEDAGAGEARVGRRSSLLRIHSMIGNILAVRLARHNIQGLLTDLDLHDPVIHTTSSSFLANPIDASLPALLEVIETLIKKSGVERRTILGIGISAPGPLDAGRGILIAPPNFPGWNSFPVRKIIEEKTGFTTFLDNDANSAALAEKWFGAGRNLDNFVFILVEDGVGGGVVINGDIYRGQHDIAGEIGHTTIDRNGPICACGNTGCLELYASPHAAESVVRDALLAGRKSLVSDLIDNELNRISFESVAQAALQGDAVANEAILGMAQALGVAVVNVINSFDPQAVILGGKISLVGEIILPVVQDYVDRRAISRSEQQLPVMMSELGVNAPVIGAFSLVLRELFQNPEFHPAVSEKS